MTTMNYAVKSADGKSIFKVFLNDERFPSNTTPEELDLWPVDPTIPEGYRQDFTKGESGWQVVDGKVTPCIEPIPVPEPLPEPKPQVVSPWQMRRALNKLGLRASVEAILAAADLDTKDGWAVAQEYRRNDPMILGMAKALDLTEEQLDNLFITAASFNN